MTKSTEEQLARVIGFLEELQHAHTATGQTFEVDTNLQGNDIYTKETTDSLPMYLGTLALIDGAWNLVTADRNGNIVLNEFEGTRVEALGLLNDELNSFSLEGVQEMNKSNTNNIDSIISFVDKC